MKYSNYYPSSGLLHVSVPLLMGTRLDALLFGSDEQSLERVWNDVERELGRIEKMLNRFDKESEVAKVNDDAQFSSVRLSDELWDIMLDCRRYFELTEGCFDITLNDFGKVAFIEESKSVRFDKYGLSLDFGGYAKGYALRVAGKAFKEAGISRALVNFGNSSVLALGSHPYGDSWSVSIEDPYRQTAVATLKLCDTAMSVSGNTPSNPQHIVNPATSELVGGYVMVAVESEDPVDAEVLTTAWIASGESGKPQWIDKFHLKNAYKLL